MNMTAQEYGELVKKATPPSPKLRNSLLAFLVGGLICTLGQFLETLWKLAGLEGLEAKTAVSCSLIALSILLTAFGIYDDLAKWAGAGTLVPITGFANSIAAPAIEFKTEGLILGTGAKMFSIAGPVLVYGVAASVLYGVIRWLAGMGG